MEFRSRYEFEAAPERVFDALTDPRSVAACLPGCDALEPIGENRYRAEMTLGVAAIKGRFKGTVELRDMDRPGSFAMSLEGKGTVGFAKGEAHVEIGELETGSSVTVQAKARVGGAVARVGQRLLVGTAKMVTDKFFACLRNRVEEGSPASGPSDPGLHLP